MKNKFTSIFIIIIMLINFVSVVLCNDDSNDDDNSNSNENHSNVENINDNAESEDKTSDRNNGDDPVNTELGEKINYPDLREVINGLTPELKQYLSNKLYQYSIQEPVNIEEHKGFDFGNDKATYQIKEFSDFNCGHCKELGMILAYLRSIAENEIYIESYQFPIDTECNPIVPKEHPSNGTGSCEMAKAVICAGQQGAYYDFKFSLFSNSAFEDYNERIELAIEESEIDRKKFDKCIVSDYPNNILEKDVELGIELDITGTPYLIWNGKKLTPNRLVIVAMILSYSNPNHNIFKELLPKPKTDKDEKK